MSGILEHILQRRSISRYHEKPVEEEKLDQQCSPLEFIAITDDKIIGRRRGYLQCGKFYAPAASSCSLGTLRWC
jgi:hypothetical protein